MIFGKDTTAKNSIGITSDVQACFLRGPADTEIAVLIAGAPPEQAAVMAQRKKRVAARRGKAATRGKARSTATGYAAKASPVAAMLAGQSGAVLSSTNPFCGLVSCRK